MRGATSCTHLLEMLIAMGTTAQQGIRGFQADRVRTIDSVGVPLKLDTCYAYGRQRGVVKLLWPQHYRPPEKS